MSVDRRALLMTPRTWRRSSWHGLGRVHFLGRKMADLQAPSGNFIAIEDFFADMLSASQDGL
jgi:hypothetical protein